MSRQLEFRLDADAIRPIVQHVRGFLLELGEELATPNGAPGDDEIMTLLDASAVSWAVVITKADKLKPAALDAVCNDTRARITTHVAAFPELFVTSAEAASGIAELRAHLGALALPRS